MRILPRSRYRLAVQSDARFQSFASNTARIAYRQQGATPAFLLFSGTGQVGTMPGGKALIIGGLLVNVVILVGILLGLGVLFNVRNLAFPMPGFSSPIPPTRTLTWAGYAAVMMCSRWFLTS